MKRLQIRFPNGETWLVNPEPIAKDRADYYATKVDGHAKGSPEWQAEVDYALDGGLDDLIDYAQNNMNWEEIEPHAARIEDAEMPNYQEMLSEAEWSKE